MCETVGHAKAVLGGRGFQHIETVSMLTVVKFCYAGLQARGEEFAGA